MQTLNTDMELASSRSLVSFIVLNNTNKYNQDIKGCKDK